MRRFAIFSRPLSFLYLISMSYFFLWQTYCSACGREFFARRFWVYRGVFHSVCVKMADFYADLA
ncbi:hypothetical protein ESA_00599 [Cronobacter sakazakii ATCC BAA-894]|uniref:Uncharacterized protein n=1 Tax=Cronobacter sakazakii (strain ATCC BAA-894) TaxID=290339 RepID=A7MHZ7_CROS8|nr:hypothetical protein ESA_00599 [Cronobacter sakazakii ATCC BAA-894]